MDTKQLEATIEGLREQWRLYPDKRPILLVQGRLLKRALEIRKKKEPPQKPLLQE